MNRKSCYLPLSSLLSSSSLPGKAKTTNLLDVVQVVNFGRKPTVYAEELLVHQRSQRQAVECLHARIINLLGVLYFACRERERSKDQIGKESVGTGGKNAKEAYGERERSTGLNCSKSQPVLVMSRHGKLTQPKCQECLERTRITKAEKGRNSGNLLKRRKTRRSSSSSYTNRQRHTGKECDRENRRKRIRDRRERRRGKEYVREKRELKRRKRRESRQQKSKITFFSLAV